MASSPLRLVARSVNPAKAATLYPEAPGSWLLQQGVISAEDLVQALSLQARLGGHLADHLLSRRAVSGPDLYAAIARFFGLKAVDPAACPADARLVDMLGAAECLRLGLLPWRHAGSAVVILTAHPETFSQHRPRMIALFGQVILAVAPPAAIEAAILSLRGCDLAHRAETRVERQLSCRAYAAGPLRPALAVIGLATIAALLLAPGLVLSLFLGWAALTLILSTLLKSAATVANLRASRVRPPPPLIARLPTVSVMVALYREGDIAARLVQRLGRLEYPRNLLDILLVVEAHDRLTRDALSRADLPGWMRVIVVPDGAVKTKPRALNHALDQCRGSIIGVYDAEDAPEPDQIRRVVDRFHQCGPQVACLQGVLDFCNPRTNWLSRCFTIEYASWFRMILPGIARLGLPVPLGGTTLFFRRAVLEQLGAWDAWNVTEDADLGMRLARRGYVTEIIDTVTMEEACCGTVPWVKQRSRWLKGYMMTWIVHMRAPVQLWRDLGPWRFAGFQVLFLCTLSQFLLVPLLWSLWLVTLGWGHPVVGVIPAPILFGTMSVFVLADAINILIGILALRRTGHRLSPLWVPTLSLYFPLGALSSYKAAWEVVTRPFYWDKTSHGHFDTG